MFYKQVATVINKPFPNRLSEEKACAGVVRHF